MGASLYIPRKLADWLTSSNPEASINPYSRRCLSIPKVQPITNSGIIFGTTSGPQQRAMALDMDDIVDEEAESGILMQNCPKLSIGVCTIGNIFNPQRHREGDQCVVGQHLCFDDSDFSNISAEELRYRDLCIVESIYNKKRESVCDQATSTSDSTSQCGQCRGLKRKLDKMSGLAREGPSFKRFMKDIEWAPPDTECHNLVRSAFVDRIRRAILDQPRSDKKVFHIAANGYDDSNFKPNRNVLSAIEKYIIKNHEGNTNPSIRPKAAQRWMRLDEVVGTRKMAPCEWGSFFDGDSEAYAMVEIDKVVILGQFVGVEMTEEEWRTLFYGTKEETVNKKYLGGDTVRVPDALRLQCGGNGSRKKELKEPPRKRRKTNNRNHSIESTESSSMSSQTSMGYSESSSSSLMDSGEQISCEDGREANVQPIPELINLVYDPIMAESNMPLMRINDCRANIRKETLEDEDMDRSNCEMISVLVNGWPTTLIRSTKRIEKDEALFFYYGSAYTEVMDSIDLIALQRQKNEQVANEILSDCNL